MSNNDLPSDLLPLANALLSASQISPLSTISDLLAHGAPAWYQDPQLGWSCLHYAAERREPDLLEILLQGGAVWNAIDHWGRTAGEVSLSLGDSEGWEVIRNEGVRSGEHLRCFMMGPIPLKCYDACMLTGRQQRCYITHCPLLGMASLPPT